MPLSQALVPCPLPHPGCSGHRWKAPFTTGATVGRLPMIQNVTSRLSQMVRLIHKGSPSHRSDPSEPQASFVRPLWVSFLSFGFLDPSATSATWLVSVSATHRCDQGQVLTLPWLHITFCKREIRRWLGPRAWHKGTSQERSAPPHPAFFLSSPSSSSSCTQGPSCSVAISQAQLGSQIFF